MSALSLALVQNSGRWAAAMEGRLRASCQGTGQLCLARAPGCTSLSSLQESWERLLASSRYNEQESFAVVFQPFFYETALSPLSVGEVTVAHRHPSPPTQLELPALAGLLML